MRREQKAFTLIELLVVISIIALLLSILMPALSKVKEQAQKIVCGSNLKQQGVAFVLYASSNNSKFPRRLHPGHWPHGAMTWYDSTFTGIDGGASSFTNPAFVSGQATLLKGGYIDDPEFMFCPSTGNQQYNYKDFLGMQPAFASSGDVQDLTWYAVYVGYDYWVGYRSNHEDVTLGKIGQIDPVLEKAVALDSTSPSSRVIATDMIATESDYERPFRTNNDPALGLTFYNHLRGDKLLGGDVVYSDGSVRWESMDKMKEEVDSNGNYKRIRLDLPTPLGRNTVFWF